MKKILKSIAFLSLAMCLMLNTNVVHAGGEDKEPIIQGNKRTDYVSHKTLEELVAAEKKEEEGQALARNWFAFVAGGLLTPLRGVIATMTGLADLSEWTLKYFYGDSTFLTNCLQKSKDNGESGCIMKFTLITHDETPDEWYPDSCEPQ